MLKQTPESSEYRGSADPRPVPRARHVPQLENPAAALLLAHAQTPNVPHYNLQDSGGAATASVKRT